MLAEVKLAINYILSYLYNNLPRLRVDGFGQALEARLFEKLHNHWFPLQPCRDVQYRCLRVTGPHADPILTDAAQASGLEIQEINSFLPTEELCMWIDPGEVTYRIGAKGSTEVLGSLAQIGDVQLEATGGNTSWTWSSPNPVSEACFPCLMNPVSHPAPPNHLDFGGSPGLNSSSTSVSPMLTPASHIPNLFSPVMVSAGHLGVPPINSGTNSNNQVNMAFPTQMNIQKSFSTPSFTAAAFAQTKFGSTKLKSPVKSKTSYQPHQPSNIVTNFHLQQQQTLPGGGGGVHRVSPISSSYQHPLPTSGHVTNPNGVCELLGCQLPLVHPQQVHPATWNVSQQGVYSVAKELENKFDPSSRSLPISPQPSINFSSTSPQQQALLSVEWVPTAGQSNNKRCIITENLPQSNPWYFSSSPNAETCITGNANGSARNLSPEWGVSNSNVTNSCKLSMTSPFWHLLNTKENAVFQS